MYDASKSLMARSWVRIRPDFIRHILNFTAVLIFYIFCLLNKIKKYVHWWSMPKNFLTNLDDNYSNFQTYITYSSGRVSVCNESSIQNSLTFMFLLFKNFINSIGLVEFDCYCQGSACYLAGSPELPDITILCSIEMWLFLS